MARKKRRTYPKAKAKAPRRWHPTYLNSSFMLASIIGFFVSYYLVLKISPNFGISFLLLFIIMFIAAVVSMTTAPIPRNPKRY